MSSDTQQHERGQVGLPEDRRQLAATDRLRERRRVPDWPLVRAGGEACARRGRRYARCRPRDRFGIRHVECGRASDRRSSPRSSARRPTTAWPGDPRGRPATGRTRRRRAARRRLPRSVTPDPAATISRQPSRSGVRDVRERDGHGARRRSADRAAPRTRRPGASSTGHRPRAGTTGRPRADAASASAPRDRQPQVIGDRLARGRARVLQFRIGHGAIEIEVDVLPRLEGRDLGMIDDDVERYSIRLDPDAGVVVDREVAERVRQ